MAFEIERSSARAQAKLTAILRCRGHANRSDLMTLYKSQVLSVLEYPTAAVYHATGGLLKMLDAVQGRFLKEVGLSEEEVVFRPDCKRSLKPIFSYLVLVLSCVPLLG